MTKVIVRADDLGYSEAVNLGIEKTVKDGIINNVGVMVNMPATQHGLDLLAGTNVCLGCHTVICAGRPLTDPKLIPSITTPDGYFKPSKVYRSAKHDFVNLDEVIIEFEAQYQRFVALTGHKPGYFEGHAVVSDNFIKGLQLVAEKHGVRFLNFSFDGTPTPLNGKNLYVAMESMQPNYDPLATLKKMALATHADGYGVMVCHPGYLDNYILTHSSLTIPRTQEVAMLCDDETRDWLKENNIELIRYDEV